MYKLIWLEVTVDDNMGGGLIQLLCNRGIENIYLTTDPQTTLFKAVYMRHSNFSTETHSVPFKNDIAFGREVICDLPMDRGDLISGLVINLELPSMLKDEFRVALSTCSMNHDKSACRPHSPNHAHCRCACSGCIRQRYADTPVFSYCNAIGHVIVEWYRLIIGGVTIEKHYGEWLEIWSELTQPLEKRVTYNELIGRVDGQAFSVDKFIDALDVYIPLNFWFCRNIGLALPLVALHRQQVSIGVKFRDFNACWVTNVPDAVADPPQLSACLLVDYVYLDIDERLEFYDKPKCYLIEQVQRCSHAFNYQAGGVQVDLPFKYPMKELIWIIQRDEVGLPPTTFTHPITREGYPLGNDHFNYSLELNRRRRYHHETFDTATLVVNGSNLFQSRRAKWYRLYQPYLHHTKGSTNFIYVYCFSQRPESYSPTGVFNFSMADKIQLHVNLNLAVQPPSIPLGGCRLTTYGVNYNVFVIEDGMCSVLFT